MPVEYNGLRVAAQVALGEAVAGAGSQGQAVRARSRQ
jgi:hypothetical protein